MTSAQIFDRTTYTAAQIAEQRLRRALGQPAGARLQYLTELIALSGVFSLKPSQNIRPMPSLQTEILAFLRQLEQHAVEYLLIGGFAVNAHGFARYTGDLDLWVHDTPANRLRLSAAAVAAGIAGGEILGTMDWVPGWTGFQLANGFEVELTGYIAAFQSADFLACFARANFMKMGDVSVPVLGLEDLICEKQTTGRPRDLEDVEQLQILLRLRPL